MEILISALIIVGLIGGIIYAIASPRDFRNVGAKNVMSGAFYELMDKDKQKANEVVLQQAENKKMEEEELGEGKDSGAKSEER